MPKKKEKEIYHAFGGARITVQDAHDILCIFWRWKNGLFRGQHIPWMLDIRCSFGVQTIIDFSFCLQAAAGEDSGVNLIWGLCRRSNTLDRNARDRVTEMGAPIPGILS